MKSKILESYREQPNVLIEGSQVKFFPGISTITLRKNKNNNKFLTEDLCEWGITYRWSFPFRLLVTYQSKLYSLRSIQEAKKLHAKLKIDHKAKGESQQTAKVRV